MCGVVGLLVVAFLIAYYFWFLGVLPIEVLYALGALFLILLIGSIVRSIHEAR